MNIEVWAPVYGFHEYSVSDHGSVKSNSRTIVKGNGERMNLKEKTLSASRQKTGYFTVSLYRAGRGYRKYIHALVLEAFRGPRPLGLDGSHLDGIRSNNRLSNLVWESRSHNNLRKREHGTASACELRPTAKLTNVQALEIRRRYENGEMQRRLAAEFGVSQSGISLLCSRKNWATLEVSPQ